MALRTGTYNLTDLEGISNVNVIQFGLDNTLDAITGEYEAHNAVLQLALNEFVVRTIDPESAWGGGSQGDFQEVGDFGTGATQKATTPDRIGTPLNKYAFPVAWTQDYLYETTPAALAAIAKNVMTRDVVRYRVEMARAMFKPTNYVKMDRYGTQLAITIKPFVNADGATIPMGPNGQVFDGATHTHYMASATLTTTIADAAIQNLLEHGHGAGVRILVNQANVAAWTVLTGWTTILPATIIAPNNVQIGQGALDIGRVSDRLEGYYRGYPVYSRTYVPAGYFFVHAVGDNRKSMRLRVPRQTQLQGLRLESSEKVHPIYVQHHENRYGFSANERTNGVAVFTAGGAYVEPIINL